MNFYFVFSEHVKLAATNALLNSLEFTRANFEKEVSGCEIFQRVHKDFRFDFIAWSTWKLLRQGFAFCLEELVC